MRGEVEFDIAGALLDLRFGYGPAFIEQDPLGSGSGGFQSIVDDVGGALQRRPLGISQFLEETLQ
jgi:hypothetical protein